MKRFLTFFLLLFFTIQHTVLAKEPKEPQSLYAQSAVLMDAESGRVLFEKNGNEVLAMASTTKIMTCILALEEGRLEDVVTASSIASAQPKVHLGMKEGERFFLEDLLYSLMLESHNDSAVAIAEHIAGSTEEFAKKMNQKAAQIGCEDTYFITPNGLDATDDIGSHSTTAVDLAKIMSYCVVDSPRKNEFLKITQMANYTFCNVEGNRTFTCSNKNSLLYMYEGIISGKTGFTGKAGYCYVGAVKRDERTYVVALLACGWPNNKNYKWKDSMKLMDYAIDNYTYKTMLEEVNLPHVEVDEGIPKKGNMFAKAYLDLEIANKNENKFLCREDEKIHIITTIPEIVDAPVRKGDVIGSVAYYIDEQMIKEYAVVSSHDIEEKTFAWYFKEILRKYIVR